LAESALAIPPASPRLDSLPDGNLRSGIDTLSGAGTLHPMRRCVQALVLKLAS